LNIYGDTSFLVSLYVSDAHTGRANAWMKRRNAPLPFTPLHRHEMRNAIRLAVRRKQLGGAQKREIFRLIDSDLKDGFLVRQPVAWIDAFREADRIGEARGEVTGVRAADLLHLGIALTIGAAELLTFDATQRKTAIAVGFKCEP